MRKIKNILVPVVAMLGIGLAVLSPANALAVEVYQPCADGANSDTAVCAGSGDDVANTIKTVINVLLFVVGVISVIVIIIGGIMFATSAGNQANVTKAKDAILYAVIGLVVALLGFAIVNWVIDLF